MRAVPVLLDHPEALHRRRVADHVVQLRGAVLLHPARPAAPAPGEGASARAGEERQGEGGAKEGEDAPGKLVCRRRGSGCGRGRRGGGAHAGRAGRDERRARTERRGAAGGSSRVRVLARSSGAGACHSEMCESRRAKCEAAPGSGERSGGVSPSWPRRARSLRPTITHHARRALYASGARRGCARASRRASTGRGNLSAPSPGAALLHLRFPSSSPPSLPLSQWPISPPSARVTSSLSTTSTSTTGRRRIRSPSTSPTSRRGPI